MVGWVPIKIRPQISLDINIVLVKTPHYSQLEKPTNYSHLLLGVLKFTLVEAYVEVVNESIALAEFIEAYRWPGL